MWFVLVEEPPQSVARLLVVSGGHVVDSNIDADLTAAVADVASDGDDGDGVDYSSGSVARLPGDGADIERQRSSCAPPQRQPLSVALDGADPQAHLLQWRLRSKLDVGGGANDAAAGVGGNKSRK